MVSLFLTGLAAEAPLLAAVLGDVLDDVAGRPAEVSGLRLVASDRGPWPVAVVGEGAAPGLWLALEGAAFDRLDFVLRSLGLRRHDLGGQGLTYLGTGQGNPAPVAPGDLAVVLAALPEILSLHGTRPPEALASRLQPMLVRAASRLRAGHGAPATLRHAAGPGDVAVAALRQPYAHFFAIEEYDVSWRRFDGTPSDTVTRAAFLSGDAVTVLPYDPVRDRVLVVEQFRAGPLARGDAQCWQIEAIAGRVDPFETPEDAARREAVEEAGLTLSDLRFVARYYPSPGAVSEYLYSYVALTDLPDGSAGVFGQEDEAEDIRGHLLPFERFMGLVQSGEIENAPLILTALWLQRERPALRL